MDTQINIEARDYAKLMLEHMPVGVALYDARTSCLLAANSLFQQFLDPPWRDGKAIGLSPAVWLPQAESLGLLEIFRNVVETGKPYLSGQYMFPALERGITYWNWTLSPLCDKDGHVVQVIQTVIEITDQVMAQGKAGEEHTSAPASDHSMESERKRLSVIETVARRIRESLDPIHISQAASQAIFNAFDTQYVFIHTADPAQQALRLLHFYPKPDETVQISLLKYIPYSSPFLIAQAHRQREPIMVPDVMAAQSQGGIPEESPLATSTVGSYICVPLWFGEHFEGTLTASFTDPITIDGPEVQTLLGCSTHVATALANARLHAAVESERARLRSILDQLPEGIIITEAAHGGISYANAAAVEMLGISVDALIASPVNRNAPTYTAPYGAHHLPLPWNFTIISALSGETTSSQETVMVRPDGKKVTILSSTAPVRSRWGTITGAVIVFQDITAQKSLEQQKNEFLSFASHELRTPVTAIQGFAEILQLQIESGAEPGPQSLRALSIINEQSQALSRLIDEMLDLTRIDNMQLKLFRAWHDLVEIVKNVIETHSSTTKKHHLRLVLEGLSDTEKVMAHVDSNRVTQIIGNLVSNAIKYSPDGGEIEIGLHPYSGSRSEVLLWVTDHGIGISAAEAQHIFKRFHRVQDVDPSISGLGIGLYLAKELVTLHRGRIWVNSVEGRGSTFYVQLPLNVIG